MWYREAESRVSDGENSVQDQLNQQMECYTFTDLLFKKRAGVYYQV